MKILFSFKQIKTNLIYFHLNDTDTYYQYRLYQYNLVFLFTHATQSIHNFLMGSLHKKWKWFFFVPNSEGGYPQPLKKALV